MARRFFYVAAGLFLLVAAYQLGVSRAVADWSGAGWAIGTADGRLVWNALGEAYSDDYGVGWNREAAADLPVPSVDVKIVEGGYYGWFYLVTHDDVVWKWTGVWTREDPGPGGPVSVNSQSFGKTKATYR
jgi:hypothetical protein